MAVSAIEVAVIVADCAELVGADAVNVAEVVVVFDRVPPPLTLQVTPAEFLSFVTVAVNVVVSLPSTVLAANVTATLAAGELPPQPVKVAARTEVNRPRMTNQQKNLR